MSRMAFASLATLLLISVAVAVPLPSVRDEDAPKLWAVLISGSYGYENYRHQADVCHAYQILHNHGIPDEQIIVMMYDDVADDTLNPTPGILINRPNGSDVYAGVPKDYTGNTLTVANIRNILLGDEGAMKGIGSGKVLKSGPKDHVFINYVDHGTVGLIALPKEEFYADDLIDILQQMHTLQKYEKLAFYLEACEAGSMFEGMLPANLGIYAMTATGPTKPSYACYYDSERKTYLGDLFSVNWMENSDGLADLSMETLNEQYLVTKNLTDMSDVQLYGNKFFLDAPVSEFEGNKISEVVGKEPQSKTDAVPAEDVPIEILKRQLEVAQTADEKEDLRQKIETLTRNRAFVSRIVKEIVGSVKLPSGRAIHVLETKAQLTHRACYFDVVRHFSKRCFSLALNPFALRQVYAFNNLCAQNVNAEVIKEAMDAACTHPPITNVK